MFTNSVANIGPHEKIVVQIEYQQSITPKDGAYALRLPLVTDDSEVFEFQIILGGISLVLSRLHPQRAHSRFTYTRGLAVKLMALLESGDPGQGRPSGEHLSRVIAECDRALDPGTLVVLRRLQLQTLKDEQDALQPQEGDFTYSTFVAGEKLRSHVSTDVHIYPPAATGPLN